MASVYDFTVKDIKGQEIPMSQFKDKTMLIVNTASKCGFTPQYEGLNNLYEELKDQDVVVLGFPCNQFGGQEPGKEEDIQEFCQVNYGVNFPMFSKIDVNGDEAHPLFSYLKEQAPGLMGSKAIKWNFTKFLVNKKGEVVKRFAPKDKPETITQELKKNHL